MSEENRVAGVLRCVGPDGSDASDPVAASMYWTEIEGRIHVTFIPEYVDFGPVRDTVVAVVFDDAEGTELYRHPLAGARLGDTVGFGIPPAPPGPIVNLEGLMHRPRGGQP